MEKNLRRAILVSSRMYSGAISGVTSGATALQELWLRCSATNARSKKVEPKKQRHKTCAAGWWTRDALTT